MSAKTGLRWSEDQGHHLVVVQQAKEGCTMIKEQPLVVSLPASSWRSQCRRCLTIFQPNKTTYPCPRCFSAHYCCTRCTEQDKEKHNGSGECLLMQANQSRSCAVRPFMREACLAARLLHQSALLDPLQSNQAALLDRQGPSGDEAQDLMITAVAVAAARAQAAADAAETSTSQPDIAAAMTAACQVATNALEVMPTMIEHCMPGLKGCPAGVGIPLALYRVTSRINHSCCPNAAYFFKPDGTVEVRSMRGIQPGEQLTISYTDLLQTLDERQQSLMQRYAFTCCCARCLDDSPTPGDWFLDAVAADDLESATQLSQDLQRLLRRGSALLLQEGSAAAAICMLEPGLFEMLNSGVHPLHSCCLDIYTCLSSAWRLHARGHKGRPQLAAAAYARGALYTLMLAHGLKELLKSGVDGILPHHARQLSDATSSMCACLKTLLQVHHIQTSDQPPPKRPKLSAPDDSELQQHSGSVPQHQQDQCHQQPTTVQHAQQPDLQMPHMQPQQQQQGQQMPDSIACTKDSHPMQLQPPVILPQEEVQAADNPAAPVTQVHGDMPLPQQHGQEAEQEPGQEAEGIWQTLVGVATSHDQDLCQQIAQQCQDDDMAIMPDLRLADQQDFMQLATASDFHMISLQAAGLKIVQPVLAQEAATLQYQLGTHDCQQLVAVAAAASAGLAAASASLEVAFGSSHQLWEVNCFLPFSSGLSFATASAITQAASIHTS